MVTKQMDITINTERREIIMTRIFDAPRHLVFKTVTDPKLIPQWWGPRYLTTTVDRMEVKPGGTWRIVQRDEDGNEYAFHGEYREVTPPERLVNTFIFEGYPDVEVIETYEFEDIDGKTRIVSTSVFPTQEALDGMVQSGMESGARETWERLTELLSTL
jgi:uncharacterized protein YndB with AHSA1/START domain